MNKFNKMKLLVTGGAGFINSNFVHYMLDRYPSYEIINFWMLDLQRDLENLRSIQENISIRSLRVKTTVLGT